MIWIAIAIIVFGYLIVHVGNLIAHAITQAKQKELEANPEYRKKVALELKLALHKIDSERYDKKYEEAIEKWNEAKTNDDKEQNALWEKKAHSIAVQRFDEIKKIEEYENQLSFGILKTQPIFKYNFVLSEVNLEQQNFRYHSRSDSYLKDDKLKASLKELKGLPISIILEGSKEFPHEGEYIAKCKAEDKGSEIVATLLGGTFGGNQKHQINQQNSSWTLHGQFVYCKLMSIEQVPSTPV
jgi:hypothetical protein